ncbi:hypothetical protein LCGC14_0442600 [marine sediment metagenome]|uniref:Uncharacterized protein n=1 Tax=marine sediment metagenome TaxID=412755 RepID=A0A0F9SJZ6_9ZZZZ
MKKLRANKILRDALEIWEEYWPHINKLSSPYDRYLIRHLDIGLRYIAELVESAKNSD